MSSCSLALGCFFHELKKWSWESTKNYIFHYDAYTDIDDYEDEEELEAEQEAIEKEHEDHLLLKSEESMKASFKSRPS